MPLSVASRDFKLPFNTIYILDLESSHHCIPFQVPIEGCQRHFSNSCADTQDQQTVMSPFISINANDTRMSVSSQFWVFWAVAGPITVFVLLAWFLWLQRVEVMKKFEEMLIHRRNRQVRSTGKV